MITNIKSTERILHRVELQRLQQERDDLVIEHIELMDILNEITEEIKDLEVQMDILTFTIEETGTTKEMRRHDQMPGSHAPISCGDSSRATLLAFPQGAAAAVR